MAAQSATGVSPVPPPTPPSGPVVVRTDNALDGRGNVLRAHRIGIANGRITSLTAPARGTVIDLRGYTVMPGWIDTHVHLDSHWNKVSRIATDSEPPMEAAMGIAPAAWETLQGGFTTIQSVGDPSEKPLRDVIRDHGFPGPGVLTWLAWVEGKGDSTGTPEQMRAIIRQRKADGADLIQIFASTSQRVGATPTLTQAQLEIFCSEAKAQGLRSMVHAYRSQVSAAALAGCNQVEHATYATADDIATAVRAGTVFVIRGGVAYKWPGTKRTAH